MEPLALILAVAKNGVIGKNGQVPWRIPEDLKFFKQTTMGHAIVMGRKTYEETKRPLPGRRNLVVSRNPGYEAPGCEVFPDLESAIAAARATDPAPFVIGGAEIYRLALPLATRIVLTEIDWDAEGDTVFQVDKTGFVEVERRPGETPGVTFIVLERAPPYSS